MRRYLVTWKYASPDAILKYDEVSAYSAQGAEEIIRTENLATVQILAVVERFNWNTSTLAERCAEFKRLDRVFDTRADSPLHHNNRCKYCKGEK